MVPGDCDSFYTGIEISAPKRGIFVLTNTIVKDRGIINR